MSRITQRGVDVLSQKLEKIDVKFLKQFPEFNDSISLDHSRAGGEREVDFNKMTPEEYFESIYKKFHDNLATELLQKLKTCSIKFFERLVIEVIVRMGYGGTRRDVSEAIGRFEDKEISGIIKKDKLGLDVIYIQAKQCENTVGLPEVQKFVERLADHPSKKGLFITTSDFSSDAKDYLSRIDAKALLIDGRELANLMIEHNVGVTTVSFYPVKKIDYDYFE